MRRWQLILSLLYAGRGLKWSRAKAFPNYSKGSPFFSKIFLFNSSYGWACVGGALYRTSNGGHSFAEILTSTGPVLADLPGEYKALTVRVNGPGELASDGRKFLYIVESMQGRLLRLNLKRGSIRRVVDATDRESTEQFAEPNAVATDREGNVFIVDFNGRIRKLDVKTGKINEYSPTVPNQTSSFLEVPASATVDRHGDLLVVDRHHRLFRWRPGAEKLETLAGSGRDGFGGDGGLAANAMLSFPSGVAVNGRDDIFIADYQNCRIRRVDGQTQIITTVAGTGECASDGDGGQATNAAVDYPSSLVLDGKGNLFFVESGTGLVRFIDPHGVISTYAGTGKKGFSGDGGLADKARLGNPSGLALDADGNLYISDFVTNRVRRVDALTHIIKTIAGNGRPTRVDVTN
jgi:sugar lactone lactonase YvrE